VPIIRVGLRELCVPARPLVGPGRSRAGAGAAGLGALLSPHYLGAGQYCKVQGWAQSAKQTKRSNESD